MKLTDAEYRGGFPMTDEQVKRLMQFAEFEEEDGSPVAVCDPGCGRTRVACLDSDDYWSAWGWVADDCEPDPNYSQIAVCEYDTEHMDCLPVHGLCPGCGILVGFTDDGRPYRIRHSRVVEALEQAQAERDHYKRTLEWALREMATGCPFEGPECRIVELGIDAEEEFDEICYAHRLEAALAATKEAQP